MFSKQDSKFEDTLLGLVMLVYEPVKLLLYINKFEQTMIDSEHD
jgi:hypothetical protein